MVFRVPDAHLQDYADTLQENTGKRVTVPQLSEFLKKKGIVRKKLQKEAKERDPELRAAWIRKLAQWTQVGDFALAVIFVPSFSEAEGLAAFKRSRDGSRQFHASRTSARIWTWVLRRCAAI